MQGFIEKQELKVRYTQKGTDPQKLDKKQEVSLERSRETGRKVKHLRILSFKLNRAKPAQSRMNALSVVVGFNIFEYIPTSLFRIVIIGIFPLTVSLSSTSSLVVTYLLYHL